MEIEVVRKFKGPEYTIGKMYLNGEYFCDTLEDPVRILNSYEDKIYGNTAIPMGVYEVKLTYSGKFKRILPEIIGVDFFKYIRIHAGNTNKDTEGCILIGENKVKGKVINSRKAVDRLMKILKSLPKNEKIRISVR